MTVHVTRVVYDEVRGDDGLFETACGERVVRHKIFVGLDARDTTDCPECKEYLGLMLGDINTRWDAL